MRNAQALKRLKLENKKLAGKLAVLEDSAKMQLTNSMSGLVQQAFLQSNLTSFNPILQNNIYAPLTINWSALMYMYKTHGVIQTAIDMPVLDGMRGGLELTSDQLGVDELRDLEDDLEELGILDALGEAAVWTRLFGGGGVIINTHQAPETPLTLKSIKEIELYPFNRWELLTTWKPNDKLSELTPWEWAAQKDSEFVYFYGLKVHKSRILTMNGKAAPYIVRWQLQGWGMSEVERMIEDFNSYIKTKNVLYDLLEVAKTDVYQFEGMKSQLATAVGTGQLQKRLELMNELKNFNNALVMDKNDVYDQKQITFSGLAEVMKENRIGIASALRMPMTKLYGLSATGFSSGEDDIENYNAMVESEVRQRLRRPIKKILNLLCAIRYQTDVDLKFKFRPLRVLGEVEEEAVKTSKSNRILAWYDRGLLDSREAGQIAQKDNLIPIETAAAQGLLDEHPNLGDTNPLGKPNEDDGDDDEKDDKKKKKSEETDK